MRILACARTARTIFTLWITASPFLCGRGFIVLRVLFDFVMVRATLEGALIYEASALALALVLYLLYG